MPSPARENLGRSRWSHQPQGYFLGDLRQQREDSLDGQRQQREDFLGGLLPVFQCDLLAEMVFLDHLRLSQQVHLHAYSQRQHQAAALFAVADALAP